MHDSPNVDRKCASALLDAWRRSDSALMTEVAAMANVGMKEFYLSNPAESERMELLGAIALELSRACSRTDRQKADPYVRLLVRLVNPEAACHRSVHAN